MIVSKIKCISEIFKAIFYVYLVRCKIFELSIYFNFITTYQTNKLLNLPYGKIKAIFVDMFT